MSEKWNVGEPGGPAGPFYSVVSQSGRIIAMQIPDKDIAEKIAKMPELDSALQDGIEHVRDLLSVFNNTWKALGRTEAQVENLDIGTLPDVVESKLARLQGRVHYYQEHYEDLLRTSKEIEESLIRLRTERDQLKAQNQSYIDVIVAIKASLETIVNHIDSMDSKDLSK